MFDFIYATQDELQFNITRRMNIRSKPRTQICTSVMPYYICCDSINRSRSGVGISSSHLAYGVQTSNKFPRPLTFTDLFVEQYVPNNEKRKGVITTQRRNGSLPLLRLSIGMHMEMM